MNRTQKGLVAFVGGVTVAWGALVVGPAVAQAIPPGPNSCVSGGGGFIGYGHYRDCDLWPDGSFWHEVSGGGPFAWGGSSGRVCDGMPPTPTDSDPTTPCPGVARLMGRTDDYVSLFVPTGEPNGDKPDGYFVRNLGDLAGLVAMLQAHTGETISANELKLVGYDRLTQLFQVAAAAGGRVDK